VVIVIEPLDHTERSPVASSRPLESGMAAVEESGAQIEGLIPGGPIPTSNPKKPLSVDEWQAQGQLALRSINETIEEQIWYQKFVRFLVEQDLRRKGYPPQKIDQALQKMDQQRKKR
jgi:hypothetical protein